MVITSREYILKRAEKEIYIIDDLSHFVDKYVIEINSFTRRIRTEILYNHLKNSDLEEEYIENFLERDYKYIIDHKNYNPRIIDHLTKNKRLKNIKPKNYFDFFVENLQNPSQIWEHVYNNLPNDLYKAILLFRFMISEQTPVESLKGVIMNLITQEAKFQSYSFDEFEYIIREFEGTFFKFQTDFDEEIGEEYIVIEFQNPSVIDFIDGFIWTDKNWLRLIVNNAIHFEQLFNWNLLECIKEDASLTDIFLNKVIKDFSNLKNASFGYFEYDAPDEATFDCWKPTRYNYYLSEMINNIDILERDDYVKIGNFLKAEVFRHQLNYVEDISEKISFLNVAEFLLNLDLISSEEAINFYLKSNCEHIKELVFLEYMSRHCTKSSLKLIRNNKRLVEASDYLFLDEIEEIEKKDFVDLIDFLDDFTQIKNILPLRRTKKKFQELNFDLLYERSAEKMRNHSKHSNIGKKDNVEYFDIEDDELISRLQGLRKKL